MCIDLNYAVYLKNDDFCPTVLIIFWIQICQAIDKHTRLNPRSELEEYAMN